MKLSIVVTTFQYRFEKYFKPLVNELVKQNVNNYEIIAVVNGENRMGLDAQYRADMLSYCATKGNVYPFMFPAFRGVAKLWNTGVVNSTGEYILILNDDIAISESFLSDVESVIEQAKSSVLFNGSFSHYMVKRFEIDELGYFDERYIGIGEEDGDFRWRYISQYGRDIYSASIRGLVNYVDGLYDYKPTNMRTHSGTKYSLFNQTFTTYKYKMSTEPNAIVGMFQTPMECILPVANQYPYEKFYMRNKDKL